ncbi:MAG: prepilin-type N-terminal cleavage/methylation domain-containing protein [Coriobacteriales bacterium]|jgi:prepilin-type N-terminal cleavage/methylation domain-containing protein|nr:prepilin-type N-terminal cleavage/methylation domain-containing protein [Coriobacteriales bacterium]
MVIKTQALCESGGPLVGRSCLARKAGSSLVSQGGFTLVELIVSLLIFGLVIGIVTSIMAFSANFLRITDFKESDKELAETSADFIKERLLYATSIEVKEPTGSLLPATVAASGDVLFIGQENGSGAIVPTNTGQLYYLRQGDSIPKNVFGKDYYQNQELTFTYEATIQSVAPDSTLPPKAFSITLTVMRDNQPSRDSTKTFSLYDLPAGNPPTQPAVAASLDKPFYLLFRGRYPGYTNTGLLLHLDAIDNAGPGEHKDTLAELGGLWHDLSGHGNDLTLSITDVDGSNTNPVRESSLYFDGDKDYGVISTLDLSLYSEVTVEVVFRKANTATGGMLFEYSENWNTSAGFGVSFNCGSSKYASGYMHTNFSKWTVVSASKPINYEWDNQNVRFTTHSNFFGMASSPQQLEPRIAWVEGERVSFYGSGDPPGTTPLTTVATWSDTMNTFSVKQPLYIAIRGTEKTAANSALAGEIASVRIYDHKLSSAEVAQNYLYDRLRFGSGA